MTSEVLIRLRDVCLTYTSDVESVRAIADVSLELQAGELLAIRGASGSGKTSLLSAIAGLMAVDSGGIYIADQDLAPLTSQQRAAVRLRDIGVVFQDHNLIPEFSTLENVALPMLALGYTRAEAEREAARNLELVGLPDFGHRYPRELSGGQQQRVGISRAISGGKRILLADEPTGSLDAANSVAIFALLRMLAESGVCVVVASHDPDVLSVATRSVEVRDGAVVSDEAVSWPA